MTASKTFPRRFAAIVLGTGAFLVAAAAHAGSLQVAPVLIDQTNGPTAALTLRDVGDRPVSVQLRVFHWSLENGEDKLTPTDDVVVSPPMTTLRPGVDYVVRVVRQVRRPAKGEESYRLLVDELPDPAIRAAGGVSLLVRQSIPVFFSAPTRSAPDVKWRLVGSRLEGSNAGDRHIRISELSVVDERGGKISFGPGLRGYVLGHSSVRWQLPQSGGVGRLQGRLFVTAKTESGAIRVPVDAARP